MSLVSTEYGTVVMTPCGVEISCGRSSITQSARYSMPLRRSRSSVSSVSVSPGLSHDRVGLVVELVHRALQKSMPHELEAGLAPGRGDPRVGIADIAVDRHRHRD